MLLHEILENGKKGDVALIDSERRLTYGELKETIKSCRNRLYQIGIRQGDRVAIFARNSIEFVCTYFAIVSLGAIAVPINFQLSNREIAYILKDAGIEHIFTSELLRLDGYTSHKVIQHDIKELCNDDSSIDEAPKLPKDFSENSPCVIIYTSGTTGNPKGAVLSHKNLVRNAEQMINMKCRAEHRILCVLPMYHAFSWTASVLYPLYCGARVAIIENFILKDMLKLIRTEKLTDIYIVPSICTLLTKLAEPADLSSLRLVVCGGAPLPLELAKSFTNKFKMPICEAYGLSEASPMVTINPTGHAKQGSIGPLMPGIEARFIDSEGLDMPQGQAGELLLKGDNIMLGYWNMPEATAEAIDTDGWLHTGDIAQMDNDGYLHIVNRLKEMFISMGENVYPREVEEIIYQFPNIKEAAVVGVEDSRRGQVGVCFYSTQDKSGIDVEELRRFLQKNLALYKIPREFHELDELPRTSTGKISKLRLIDEVVGNL